MDVQANKSEFVLSVDEFELIRKLLFKKTGITLSDGKMTLVTGRLSKRLRHHQFVNFGQYYRLLKTGGFQGSEMQTFINLLTTNETYFFRESKHFDFLHDILSNTPVSNTPFRVWSAASSTGEESYSTAMTIAGQSPNRAFEILATDINVEVVQQAKQAVYPLSEAKKIPTDLLKKYCLKGVGRQSGMFTVSSDITSRVQFGKINLNDDLPNIGQFDVIFLRNVMIYFNESTKLNIVNKIFPKLKKGGYFIIGHSETLNFYKGDAVSVIRPSIYQKK